MALGLLLICVTLYFMCDVMEYENEKEFEERYRTEEA